MQLPDSVTKSLELAQLGVYRLAIDQQLAQALEGFWAAIAPFALEGSRGATNGEPVSAAAWQTAAFSKLLGEVVQ